MFDLMYESKGIGLAANQVAIPLRFFVLNLTADPEQKDQEQVFINPEIVKRHSSVEEEEGCLSFPGLYAKVKRARKVKVRAYDLDGERGHGRRRRPLRPRPPARDRPPPRPALRRPARARSPSRPSPTKIREIEAAFREAQARGEYPDDDEIRRQLDTWPENGPTA